jgi:hypothetical protein
LPPQPNLDSQNRRAAALPRLKVQQILPGKSCARFGAGRNNNRAKCQRNLALSLSRYIPLRISLRRILLLLFLLQLAQTPQDIFSFLLQRFEFFP